MDLLLSYDFLVVALGTGILAIASAICGTFSVYKGQSLVGDAIGHSTYPGIIVSFMLLATKDPLFLTLGAAVAGIIAYIVIQAIVRYSKLHLSSALAVVLSGFFGLGLALNSYIQGNTAFQGASQAGLRSYIFGQAAYLMEKDIYIITFFSSIALILMFLFYKELVAVIFDREFAKTIGYSSRFIEGVLLVMMIALISIGIKTVGSILISAFLLIPCIFANQYTKKLPLVLALSGMLGLVSAFVGTFFSSLYEGLSTGPCIILVMGSLTFLSMIFAPYGLINKRRHKNV